MRRSRRKLLLGTALAGALTAVAGVWSVAAAQQGPQTWTVWAGQSTLEGGVASNDFQPRPLEINVGDTVVWKNGGFHTVALGRDRVPPFMPEGGTLVPNPVAAAPTGGNTFEGKGEVDSGFMEQPNQEFKVTFTAPGTFKVVCDLHPSMDMDLTVKPQGQPVAMSPAAALQAAMHHFYQMDFTGRVIPLLVSGSNVVASSNDQGELQHEVTGGTGDGHVEILRFLPGDVVVHAGEWVTWVDRDPVVPHTVTFMPGGQLPDMSSPPPEGLLPEGFPFANAGPNTYTGQEFINMFYSKEPAFGAPDSVSIKFTQPGQFRYFCALHAEEGMVGTVTVVP